MSKALQDLEFEIAPTATSSNGRRIVVNASNHGSASKAFKEATVIAHRNGVHQIDVLTFSKAAAELWAGDHGAEEYDADPDASVHDRLIFDEGEWKSHGRLA